MLVFIPILAYVGILLFLGNLNHQIDWRRASLRAALVWGSYLVVLTEVLSLVKAVRPLGLSLGWLIPILGSAGWLIRRRRRGTKIDLPNYVPPRAWSDRMLLVGVLVILGITAFLAWYTPPQTWDSLNYHLSRVAHWTQEGAVQPFATGMEKQNLMQPGAELVILNFYILLGGDRLANLVEWLAMLGSLVGVSLIASQLGASIRGQLLTVVFTATLPMGIAQASSTMTDYAVAFWMVCVASESLSIMKRGLKPNALVFISLGAGLALLTKLTAVAYLLPFAAVVLVVSLRRFSVGRSLLMGLAAIIIVVVLNVGYLTRNTLVYGHPVGPSSKIALHANEIYEPRVLLSNLLRNAALHAGTPWSRVNDWLFTSIYKVHAKLGLDVQDPRTTTVGWFTVGKPNTGEATAGNPMHALLILVFFGLMIAVPKLRGTTAMIYALTVAATFLIFSFLFKWQVFGSRLHLPFFVLFAPVVGFGLRQVIPLNVDRLIAVILLIVSWPWLLSIQSRPLIPNEQSNIGSVLTHTREELYFALGQHLIEPYTTMTDIILETGCSKVGIMLSGSGAEYPLWVLLGAPDPDLEMEWIVSGTPSESYRQEDFQPCAMICEKCPEEWEQFSGLPLMYQSGNFRLYIVDELSKQ
jgi:hypothetical protein